MAASLARREAARKAFVVYDNDARVRRALLRHSVPHRGPFPQGAAVYFRRIQTRPSELPHIKWYGVARVIGHDAVDMEYGYATIRLFCWHRLNS